MLYQYLSKVHNVTVYLDVEGQYKTELTDGEEVESPYGRRKEPSVQCCISSFTNSFFIMCQ